MAQEQATAPPNGADPTKKESPEHPNLAQALLAAQLDMPAVPPDREHPHFKNKFTSLTNLLTKAKPILNKHGIVLVQGPTLNGGQSVLRTVLMHSSGESMAFDGLLAIPKNDPQAQGSAITYMRRYALGATLAIADQEDDDGNAAQEAAAQPTGELVQRLSPQRTERIIGAFKALRMKTRDINMMLGGCGIDGLPGYTAEEIKAYIASLGEVQADKLEAALEKEATKQEQDATTEPTQKGGE
jgi:hypothetical protein